MKDLNKFVIIEVDGLIRSQIGKNGKADKYGEPKLFDTCEAAGKWVDKHNYKGNTARYVIEMR